MIEDADLSWLRPLQYGIYAGGLLRQWNDVISICEHIDSSVVPEYSCIDPGEYFMCYVCLSAVIVDSNLERVSKVYDVVKRCRLRKVRLFAQCIDAILSEDQTLFEKSFTQFTKKQLPETKEPIGFNFWIGLDLILLWLLGEKIGFTFPAMSDECAAIVVRRETVGLV